MDIRRSAAFLLLGVFIHPAFGGYQVAKPAPGADTAGLNRAATPGKLGFRLGRIASEYNAHKANQPGKPFTPGNKFVQFDQGRVLIEASAADDGAGLLNDLKKFGLHNPSRYGNTVSGLLPVAQITRAAGLANLRAMHASIMPIRNAGSISSQGDVAMRADIARTVHSVDGTGVSVGVMSDSYNSLGGAGADIASGDLPAAGVTVVNGESINCGVNIFCIDEGRAMLQIVHDIAPGAGLFFHTALSNKVEFANGIIALQDAGVDVIVDDLLYLNEPYFEDGIIAQAVNTVTANGVAYYSAAGNQGRQSYESAFDDSDEILCFEIFEPLGDCDPTFERVGKMHDFDPGPGKDVLLNITVPLNTVLTVALQWDESFGNAKIDHDIVLLDESGGFFYTFGANDNVLTGEGWEVLQYNNSDVLDGNTEFSLAITYDDVDSNDPPAGLTKALIFSGTTTINEFSTDSSTLIGHANATGATAVGAAFYLDTPEYGTNPPLLEPYSSAGGTPIIFGTDGSRLPAPDVRLKPEITAVDGVNTTFFFNDSHGGDGIDDFFGTSAAAPHAAGVAALMLHAKPTATPGELKTTLASSAIDMLGAGFDFDSGYGLIQADAAIDALSVPVNTPPVANFDIASISDLTAVFTDTSSDIDGTLTAWSWDFGSDGSSTDQHPTHVFSAAGTYTVELSVTDDDGAISTIDQDVTVSTSTVNTAPVASFSYTCSAKSCTFSDLSTDPDAGDSVVSWAWDFGDGTSSTNQNPSHTYSGQGNKTVTLVVTDGNDATGAVTAGFRVKNRGNVSGTVSGSNDDEEPPATLEAERGKKKCNDGVDNDGDGLIDDLDPDC